jgi:6-phosphogluconate dehydrogenase
LRSTSASPSPTINAAVDSRNISARKAERVERASRLAGRTRRLRPATEADDSQAIRDALYASKICSYAQGMNLIRAGSENWNWDINLGETARIWKGGCIIRAQFLGKISDAYRDARTCRTSCSTRLQRLHRGRAIELASRRDDRDERRNTRPRHGGAL